MQDDREWLLEEIGRILRRTETERVRMVWWFVQKLKK